MITSVSEDVCAKTSRLMWCSSHGSNGVSASTQTMESVVTTRITPKRIEAEVIKPTRPTEAEDPGDENEDEE